MRKEDELTEIDRRHKVPELLDAEREAKVLMDAACEASGAAYRKWKMTQKATDAATSSYRFAREARRVAEAAADSEIGSMPLAAWAG